MTRELRKRIGEVLIDLAFWIMPDEFLLSPEQREAEVDRVAAEVQEAVRARMAAPSEVTDHGC